MYNLYTIIDAIKSNLFLLNRVVFCDFLLCPTGSITAIDGYFLIRLFFIFGFNFVKYSEKPNLSFGEIIIS